MKELFENIVGIRSGTDIASTVRTIRSGIPLKGYNLWMIVCSAALASLGLDTNSTAVIIGAMLISPLMSPILGVGLALGTNDRPTLTESAKNLALATAVSLATSWLYFLLTPLGETTSELLARTQPTLLDVLVAFFGGVAGIISGSRRDATNAIPGVAIATALMPPLCTAGFGLATGNMVFFFGALYLYIINGVFISIATFAIVKYLRFPVVKHSETMRGMAVQISSLLVILIVPSIYFLYDVYGSLQTKRTIQNVLIEPLKAAHDDVLSWELVKQDTIRELRVFYAGVELDSTLVRKINNELKKQGLSEYRLMLTRVNMSKEEVSRVSMETAQKLIAERLSRDSSRLSVTPQLNVLMLQNEITAAFPFVQSVGVGNIITPVASDTTFSNNVDTVTHVLLYVSTPAAMNLYRKEGSRITQYCKQRLRKDSVEVIPILTR